MRIDEIEERLSAINVELDAPEANLDALEEEIRSLQEERNQIIEEETKRQEMRDKIASGAAVEKIIEKKEDIVMSEEKRMTVDSVEYRNAFYEYLTNPTAEARTALINVDGNTAGSVTADAIAIPKTLDTMIWDNIHTAHPILADIDTIPTGIVMEVTKHTAIAARVSGKKDADAKGNAEDNTFVKVTLAGVDYDKYVELTYAEAKMSQGALESYLATEIAAELGEALAKDVFAQIEADATTARKQTKSASGDWFGDIAAALGKADHAQNPVVYASVADYYEILGAKDAAGQPIFRDGLVLQASLKKDNAVPSGHVVVVDPKMFVLNEVQGIMIESDKDVKAHKIVVSGYLRAQGCMRVNAAASYIA